MNTTLIYDFNIFSSKNDWQIINDAVMGGKSQGKFLFNSDGNGVFEGIVSLENNGGFSSVRYQFNKINTTNRSQILIRLKGDGKQYQVRIKDKLGSYYSYITTFKTTDEWQTVIIQLSNLYPSFRGQKLNLPNYNSTTFEEIAFLIGNKKKESFKLVLNNIELQ